MDREDRLRQALRSEADRVRVSPALEDLIAARTRRGGGPRRRVAMAVAMAMAMAVLLIAALVAVTQLPGREVTDVVGTPAPGQGEPVFHGFWPATTRAEAEALQARFDAGEDQWLCEPFRVAEEFTRQFLGWQEVEWTEQSVREELWTDEMREERGPPACGGMRVVPHRVRPLVGEGTNSVPGAEHRIDLRPGLQRSDAPVWFVTRMRSENIQLSRLSVSSTHVEIEGRAKAYEGNILIEVRDDDGAVLAETFTTAGTDELEEFEAAVDLEPTEARGGILILRGDTAVEGPYPDWTIHRIQLR